MFGGGSIGSYWHINHGPIDLELATDASKEGWGASLGESVTGGRWSSSHRVPYLSAIPASYLHFPRTLVSSDRDNP